MKKIYKYSLEVTTYQVIYMPRGAEILSAQIQNGSIQLWAIVNPVADPALREIYIFGTGHTIPSTTPLTFIGTVQESFYVWHIFEHNKPAQ
jgi:hypothetical protein